MLVRKSIMVEQGCLSRPCQVPGRKHCRVMHTWDAATKEKVEKRITTDPAFLRRRGEIEAIFNGHNTRATTILLDVELQTMLGYSKTTLGVVVTQNGRGTEEGDVELILRVMRELNGPDVFGPVPMFFDNLSAIRRALDTARFVFRI